MPQAKTMAQMRGNDGADQAEPDHHHDVGDQNDDCRHAHEVAVCLRVTREHHGGCGRRCQTAENAEHRRAVAGADDAQGNVAAERQSGNEDHHPPHLARVDRVIRAEIMVGQDRQDDQRKDGELQDRVDVLGGQALADPA